MLIQKFTERSFYLSYDITTSVYDIVYGYEVSTIDLLDTECSSVGMTLVGTSMV